MDMNKIIFALFAGTILGGCLYAQGVSDAIRWSQNDVGGTARVFGVGGAFGAMGGDFSVVNINPAGIGEYKKSEFVFTPSINSSKATSYLISDRNSTENYSDTWFGIDNIGVVFSSQPIGGKWNNSNFLVGFSKISNLNKSFSYEGRGIGSIVERWAALAQGLTLDDLDDFEAWPAFQTGAIYTLDGGKDYFTDFDGIEAPILRRQTVSQRGSLNEFSLGWAGNYDSKVNIGVSVGIPIASFEETKFYEESDPNGDVPLFKNLSFLEYLNTTGVGFNFKTGFILNFNRVLRIGGAIHSPTWFRLNDDYFTEISYTYFDNNSPITNRETSPSGFFKYRLNTPWRMIGSIGSIYRWGAIQGFVNMDIEYLDYANNKFNFSAFSNDPAEAINSIETNRTIKMTLDESLVMRIGTELAKDNFRFRLGYELVQSPFLNEDKHGSSFSFGIGFRGDNFFVDFGMRLSNRTIGFSPYFIEDAQRQPVVNVDGSITRTALTAGFKF